MPYAALRRYVAGESDGAERQRVAAWAGAAPARRGYLDVLRRTWARGAAAPEVERTAIDTAWVALRAQLEVPVDAVPPFVAPWDEPVVEVDMRRRRPARLFTHVFDSRRRWTRLRIAAAVLVLLGGAFLAKESASRWAGVERLALALDREVVTGPGQRTEIKLGDGSVVTLAGNSRLRFPADFGTRPRELALEGQAYFAVVHDATRPLAVTAGGSRIRDIGTEFVVRAYPEDRRVQVVVTDGEVAFGHATSDTTGSIRLTEGWMGQLTRGAAAPVARRVDPSRYTGWLTGQLVFDNSSLADVADELSRWYDVQIRFADPSLARETFTATFAAESLTETLKALTTVLRLRADRHGKVVTLRRAD